MWVNDHGIYRPLWVSSFGTLAQLIHHDEGAARAYLEWAVNTGFGGVRFFAGNLSWQDQTAGQARDVLPRALELAQEYGLYVEVTALTDSGEDPPYDEGSHVQACADICEAYGNAILEVANEPYHETQSDAVHDYDNLRAWGPCFDGPWACGAAEIDELDKPADQGGEYPTAGGSYNTAHLDRSRPWQKQMARVREQETISDTYGVPGMNNEPIGWDETTNEGRRLAEPEAFFQLGAECRVFELGCIGMGEHCRTSVLPGPMQQACADALVQGFRMADALLPPDTKAEFINGHWDNAPFTGTFYDEGAGEDIGKTDNRVWRIHSGVVGNQGATICCGVSGDPGYYDKNGWTRTLVDGWSCTQLWQVTR